MILRARYAPPAQRDLRAIGLYISTDNPTRAVSFVQELERFCDRLLTNPLRHRLREEFGPGIRGVSYRGYLILYAVPAHGMVVIQRVLHGSRDLRRITIEE